MTAGIEWLQEWYLQNCNGDWEHQYGLSISTLDNPGWQVAINLRGTALEHKSFAKVEVGKVDGESWYVVSVQEDEKNNDGPIFMAFCSPQHLTTVIGLFKTFTEKGA